MDGLTLRVESAGKDDDGNTYWYFYGTHLYLEAAKQKKKKPIEQPKGRNKGKGKKEPARKGRGKNHQPSPEKEDGEDTPSNSTPTNNSPVNVPKVDPWRIVCSTSEEWEELVERLKPCRKGDGRKLYKYLNDDLLPDILYLLEEKVPPSTVPYLPLLIYLPLSIYMCLSLSLSIQ